MIDEERERERESTAKGGVERKSSITCMYFMKYRCPAGLSVETFAWLRGPFIILRFGQKKMR